MASDKTVVVEEIWARLETEGAGRRVVRFDDVTDAHDFVVREVVVGGVTVIITAMGAKPVILPL